MSVIIDAVSAGAYVDNVRLPEALGEMHPPVTMGISISVFDLLRRAEVPGCHTKHGDVCASWDGCCGSTA